MHTINIKIAGAAVYYSEFLKYFKLGNGRKLNKLYNISLYDGPNMCKWNGGRINKDIQFTKKQIELFNSMGIGIYYTLSNNIIDLNDKLGLSELDDLNCSNLNGAILINRELNDFISNSYNIKQVYSITGHDMVAVPNVKQTEEYIKYYTDLEKTYDIIVPKMEHIFEEWFLQSVDISKYEIMVNDTCKYNCSIWKDHFEKIAEVNRTYDDPYKEESCDKLNCIEECWIKSFDPSGESDRNLRITDNEEFNGMDLNNTMIEHAISLGYRHFKISGRENSFNNIIEDAEVFLLHGEIN